jgi:hypothetical protein
MAECRHGLGAHACALVGIGMPLSSSAAVRRHDPGRGLGGSRVVASPVDAGPRARDQ